MQHEFVLRSTTDIETALKFSLGSDGLLALKNSEAKIKVLRVESNGLLTVLWGERVVTGVLSFSGESRSNLLITIDGQSFSLQLKEAAIDAMEQSLGGGQRAQGVLEIKSPIPGLVKAVKVAPNQAVTAGQTMVVLEAMKMENEIVAPHDGTVSTLHVDAGQVVAAGELLAKVKT